jgi:hypothetical protein
LADLGAPQAITPWSIFLGFNLDWTFPRMRGDSIGTGLIWHIPGSHPIGNGDIGYISDSRALEMWWRQKSSGERIRNFHGKYSQYSVSMTTANDV